MGQAERREDCGHGHPELLLSVGAADRPGEYRVPASPVAGATGWQPGTFLVGVDAARTSVAEISPFTEGSVKLEQLSATSVQGSFAITSRLTRLTDGQFDVPVDRLADLPLLCR